MAQIQPFRAIRFNPSYADTVVFTTPQVESVSGDPNKTGALPPLKILLETGARQRPETPEGQARAYQDIKEALHDLLEKDKLLYDQIPGIYVYELVHKTYRQTGIWALTALDDYTKGAIKVHELTFADSVRRLKNYRENTGLEGSPILLTYPPDMAINRIIAETMVNKPDAALGNEHGLHRLWKIAAPDIQQHLVNAFARIPIVYMADGHHRIESAAELAMEQQLKGLPVYHTLSSLYVASDQLCIQEYDRVIIPPQPVEETGLFEQLGRNFDIQASNEPVQPRATHCLGLYFNKKWYNLYAKPYTYVHKGVADNLDAAILQELVLGPVFGIGDPKTDPRLKFAGGEKAMEQITAIIDIHPEAIAFTICPLTVKQLIAVADADEILPPKSTWIVPKIPYGLLLQHHLVDSHKN